MKKFLKKKYNYKNKNVLITGGLGKIGFKLSKILYEEGANLVITDYISKNTDLKKIKNFTNKNRVSFFNCDLSCALDRKKLFVDIEKKFKKIDILINNAALTGDGFGKIEKDFEKQDYKIWNKELQVNLISVIEIIQKLKKLILKSKSPTIINLSSIYGVQKPDFEIYKGTSMKNQIGYSISKAGLIQLTKWFAAYLAPKVRVNCISPGGIIRNQPKNFVNSYKKNTLLKRMATEEDIISGILFLASDGSEYITGQNIIIDGGWTN